MATKTAAPTVENPKNPTDLNSKPPSEDDAVSTQTPPFSPGVSVDSNEKPVAKVEEGGAVTDIQKKMKRAERFGMPVQLTEVEKRNSRAERFGTAPVAAGLNSTKESEELKRKARAERFGIAQPAAPGDEEVKKKARLARFGSAPVANTAEEEKKKARALRFSQQDSGSQGNGKDNVEAKTDIIGKADAGT